MSKARASDSRVAGEHWHQQATAVLNPHRVRFRFHEWHPALQVSTFADDQVHVWRASLELPASYVERLQRTLETEELSRAERFHFDKDRRHFVVARGLLRAILGKHLGMEPTQVRFRYGPHGKPELGGGTTREALRFNVSHSYGLALYAIAHDRNVGIDVECIRPDLADDEIVERFFSPREVAALRSLPAELQSEAFFTCWTRKEAYLKARGDGLALPLDRFDVSLRPGEPAALLSVNDAPQETARWSVQDLDPGPGYVAALAVEGHGWQLRCWQWNES